MRSWGQLSFQDAASPLIFELIDFHDYALVILTLIITFVGYALGSLVINSYRCTNILEAQEVETIWTVLPAVILVFLAFPSLRLLYLLDELEHPSLTVKTIGHQWYWRYEYSDFLNLEFDSYMLPTDELSPGSYRLLEVDNRAVIPWRTEIRILVTAADVIHAWTVPRLGVKADAIPGRINQLSILPTRPGIFYGQCSEICGANHSFMPIVIEAVDRRTFLNWVSAFAE